MPTLSNSTEFLDAVEQWTNRRLCFRGEIEQLINLSLSSNRMKDFSKIVFLAKFLWSTYNIMKRIGPHGEGYLKLSDEFTVGLDKLAASIRGLHANGDEKLQARFEQDLVAMNHTAMANLMGLLHDLSQLKNYTIDTKQSYF